MTQMFQEYLEPIITAVYVFPILAAVFTLPYILHQYHKYGAILVFRIVIVYSFIFYMLTSFFMTLLPLPPVRELTEPLGFANLKVFDAVHRWLTQSGFTLSDVSTWKAALKNRELWELLFNIALLFPFGVYLRYYFKRPFWQVLILSFLYSLFFEVTQLTGVYHIYPYPYRNFDVDDLICNTIGGVIGWGMTPLFVHFLPTRERLDEESYLHGAHVSLFRRLLAFAVDAVIILLLTGGCVYLMQERIHEFVFQHFDMTHIPRHYAVYFLPMAGFVIMTFITTVSNGYSLGKWLVNIRLVRNNGTRAHFWQLAVRYFIMMIVLLAAPLFAWQLLQYVRPEDEAVLTKELLIGAGAALFCLYFYGMANVIHMAIKQDTRYRYDRICGLKTISTVERK